MLHSVQELLAELSWQQIIVACSWENGIVVRRGEAQSKNFTFD